MSNFCDQSFYQQNIYTNTYSLWENSAYYDINNLSPQNFSSSWHRGNDEDFDTRYTSGPTEVESPEPPDRRNRRTLTKESLYEDPNVLYERIILILSLDSDLKAEIERNDRWARLYWPRTAVEYGEGPSSRNKGPALKSNRVVKKLNKMLAQPMVDEIGKTESMMECMGWRDRASNVFNTPKYPNIIKKYRFKSTVFQEEQQNTFTMNILLNIYNFVQNNGEIELLFDRKLDSTEKKRVRDIVQMMLNEDGMAMLEFHNAVEIELVLQIIDINTCILRTQNEGKNDCQICMYKEAPPHVFIVVPHDLRDERGPSNRQPASTLDELSDTELEEETNPFLRSIMKKTKEAQKMERLLIKKGHRATEKIFEYFTEFTEKKQYSQFKFLGPFNEEEWEGIRSFLGKLVQYLTDAPCDYKKIFDKVPFEVGEDITGNIVISKIGRKKD